MRNWWMTLCIGMAVALAAAPAEAYIGPGAGAGTIAVVLGILASIGMAFVAIIWFPIKRMLRRKRQTTQTKNESPAE